MIVEIIRHTPLWVWALLALLLALGLSQTRSRRVQPVRLLILPLVLLVLGLSSMSAAVTAQPVVGLVWAAALLASLAWAVRMKPPAGTHWDAAAGRLHLAGSWMPLVIIVVIFLLRYTAAVSLAMHPAWRSALSVQLPLALAFGSLSGLFLGRALSLWRLTRMATWPAHDQPA